MSDRWEAMREKRKLSEQRRMAEALFAVWWGAQNDLPSVEKMVDSAWKDAGLALAKLDELERATAKQDAVAEEVAP